MNLSQIITNEITKASAGGTYDDLESPPVEPGFLLEIKHVAVENRTTAYTRLILGIADGMSFAYKEDQDAPDAATLYWCPDKLLVPEGKRLRARLSGCTSGDDLHMTYEGKLWEKD